MKKRVIFTIMLAVLICHAFAQTDDNTKPIDMGDVTVYNDYTPTIRDANRIQTMPTIVDTISVQPKFSYTINTVQHPTVFVPSPIQSADLKPEPLKPLDNGWIKLGIGNYITPYIEANYHNLRSKDYSVGAYARHHSSHGKLTNDIDQKYYAGFMDNDIKLYGKKFMNKSTLFSNISFAGREDYFYGANPDQTNADVYIPRDKAEIEKQRYSLFSINIGANSNNMGKNDLNFMVKADYHFLKAIDTTNQNYFGFNLGVNKNIKKLNVGADFDLKLYKTNIIDSSLVIPSIKPFVTYTNKQWQIRLGLVGAGEFSGDSAKYHLYPDILIQHNVSNTLIPYVSYKGYLSANDMEQMAFENPYTIYRLMVQPTSYAQIIDLGIKGNIDRKIRFHLNGNYSKIDNMYFYTIDTSVVLRNKFKVEYSNVERFSGYGEIMVVPNEKLNIYLYGHYYWYSYIKTQDRAWNMPDFDVNLFAKYQFNKELSFGGGVYVAGNRWTKNYNAVSADDHNKMKPYFDVNLQAEYAFASNFSSFIYLNNIAAQKYYIWENYRAHGFNVLLGIKYSF